MQPRKEPSRTDGPRDKNPDDTSSDESPADNTIDRDGVERSSYRVGPNTTLDEVERARRPMPDGGTARACPECDSSDIYPLADGHWGCRACRARFDTPVERKPKPKGGRYLKAALDADPDVTTDGGSVTLSLDVVLAPGSEEYVRERVLRQLRVMAGVREVRELASDGGVARYHRQDALSAGREPVIDACPFGNEDCAGLEGPGLACWQCLVNGDENDA